MTPYQWQQELIQPSETKWKMSTEKSRDLERGIGVRDGLKTLIVYVAGEDTLDPL